MAQVPRVGAPWGEECRSLFIATEGYVLVGVDASGLELRCLAHYTYPFDGGRYTEAILNGDVHTTNQEAAGLPDRDKAKTFIYALIYGAGEAKLGSIIDGDFMAGRTLKNRFFGKCLHSRRYKRGSRGDLRRKITSLVLTEEN